MALAIFNRNETRSMKVKNINGTSDATCKCGSWLNHWKKFSGQSAPTSCPAAGCRNTDLVGAHVQRESSADNNWYIYPLCSAHNVSGGTLDVSELFKLVWANKAETCEKK